ncbi:MAG TPA: pantoate--beta-alanine ligase [Rickettsiales bacterium]|nr:pantoate--beta-alanine ligase [Rickettsiales bacterium]
MEIVRTKTDLREAVARLRKAGKTIALVPTMGALHDGHISLVRIGLQHADAVVTSIFVNPTQFGPNEDFAKYPRTEEEDVRKLEAAGCTIAYIPSVDEVYGKNAITIVQVPGISSQLCGAFRPGHFDGVATVVTKLFMQAMPDVAIFGEKDYQQLHIIRQFTRDLDIPVRIIGAPLMREADGLALSSRNRYLSPEEREKAASLYQAMLRVAEDIKAGQNIAEAVSTGKDVLLRNGFRSIDYLEVRDAETLAPISEVKKPARLLAAAYLGNTRLIDNIAL